MREAVESMPPVPARAAMRKHGPAVRGGGDSWPVFLSGLLLMLGYASTLGNRSVDR